jgi:hypothetical protein
MARAEGWRRSPRRRQLPPQALPELPLPRRRWRGAATTGRRLPRGGARGIAADRVPDPGRRRQPLPRVLGGSRRPGTGRDLDAHRAAARR